MKIKATEADGTTAAVVDTERARKRWDVEHKARAVVAAWRAPVAPTPDAADHMRHLAAALGELEQALQANPSNSQPSACCVWLKFTRHSSFESEVYVPPHRVSSVKLTVNTRRSNQGHVGRAWVMTADDGYLLDDQQTAKSLFAKYKITSCRLDANPTRQI
jgi:hypothetical protein